MEKKEPQLAIIYIVAIILFCFELYFFNYDVLYDLGFGSSFFENKVVSKNLSNSKFLSTPIFLRITILLIITLTIFTSKVKRKQTTSKSKLQRYAVYTLVTAGAYIFSFYIYSLLDINNISFFIQITLSVVFLVLFVNFASQTHKLFYADLLKDRFKRDARKFEQHKTLIENQYSVNIQTEDGWINVVNPFRASQVLGTPGSGKTFSFLLEALIQHISKGFSMVIYDYKYPSLANIALGAVKKYKSAYSNTPSFSIIDFDTPLRSHRCNPLQSELILDPIQATQASKALMIGLYPKWAEKQGEFFTESSINFVAACIWALRVIQEGKYCTIPHLIQLMSLEYDELFTILLHPNDDFISNVIAPFISAYKNEATDQLEGQIGSSRIAISRLTSPIVYWTLSPDTNDPYNISLQINDPENPQILILANNPTKNAVYGPLISLYLTQLMSTVNVQNMNPTGVLIDELPTLNFPPDTLDNLIATARSNKIAVWLGFQDYAQLTRDLGKNITEAIINTVGNTFSGMVNFETAKKLSEKFGDISIHKESLNFSKNDTSTNVSTEKDKIIPPSEMGSLSQGVFVGQVADDRGYEIDQKVFYSKVLIDLQERKELEESTIEDFVELDIDIDLAISQNFERIKSDIINLAAILNQSS